MKHNFNRRRDNVIGSLDTGKERCSSCGMTFDESQQLADHLDAHFTANWKRTKRTYGSRKMYPTLAVSFANINISLTVW